MSIVGNWSILYPHFIASALIGYVRSYSVNPPPPRSAERFADDRTLRRGRQRTVLTVPVGDRQKSLTGTASWDGIPHRVLRPSRGRSQGVLTPRRTVWSARRDCRCLAVVAGRSLVWRAERLLAGTVASFLPAGQRSQLSETKGSCKLENSVRDDLSHKHPLWKSSPMDSSSFGGPNAHTGVANLRHPHTGGG
jgi:hypothetical protein